MSPLFLSAARSKVIILGNTGRSNASLLITGQWCAPMAARRLHGELHGDLFVRLKLRRIEGFLENSGVDPIPI
jgi:hypothetical protein